MSDYFDKKAVERHEIKQFSVKTLHSSSKSSFCWKYFGTLLLEKDGKKRSVLTDNVFCLKCIETCKSNKDDDLMGCCKIRTYGTKVSTGNLIRHLKDDHQIQEPEKSRAAEAQRITTFFDTRRTSNADNLSKEASRNRKWLLARDLALWICRSLLPFDSVSDEAMIDFFLKYKVIVKKEDLPSRTTISRTALDDVYCSMKAHIKALIQNTSPRSIALTTDLWSDSYKRNNYLTLTLHFFNETLNLENFTLATQLIEGKKTAEKIKEHVQELLIEYGLQDKQVLMVTDSGSNVKKAVNLLNMGCHLCLGHGLHNMVVKDGIKNTPKVDNIVKKCKKIVQCLRFRLPELEKEADEEQRRLLMEVEEAAEVVEYDELNPIDEPESEEVVTREQHVPSLKTATPTRWHSVVIMLESIYNHANRNPIHKLLGKLNKSELKIEDYEWKLIGDLIKLLNKFKDAVNIMSASNSTTINLALVFRCEIEDTLSQTNDDECLLMISMKRNMIRMLDHRFPIDKVLIAAAILDCRFQGLHTVDEYLEKNGETRVTFLSSYIREQVKEIDLPKHQHLQNNSGYESTLHNAAIAGPSSSSMMLLAISRKHTAAAAATATNHDDTIVNECWKYLGGCDPSDLADGDLLRYWREKKNSYPWLYALVRAIMSIPATSTPSERVFSVAGLVVTAKRCRLRTTNVDEIIFVHDNYNVCKQSVNM